MKKELNIAAILKDKPAGTKLWSPIFGNCKFSRLSSESGIRVFPIHNGFTSTEEKYFFKTGQYTLAGEVCLFPSKQMRDWSKFAWKKGDVLTDKERFVVFKDFNTDYTEFSASFEYKDGAYRQGLWLVSNDFRKVSDYIAQEIIKKVEEHYGGKLNLETLEIEHPKQEFKDGDIVHIPAGYITEEAIFIAKVEAKGVLHSYVYMSKDSMIPLAKSSFRVFGCLDSLRLATENEQQQLFSALEKKGKRWNPDTKQIEDLPKKCEFKPFDKVLARDYLEDKWMPNFFSCYDGTSEYKYGCIAGNSDNVVFSKYCIPYNEETAHLLGTTDEWKGGE